MDALCLHNYLGQTENALYCPTGFVDNVNDSGEVRAGKWRLCDYRPIIAPFLLFISYLERMKFEISHI